MTIPSSERPQWLAWCEGWAEWQLLIALPELLEPLNRPLRAFAPPPEFPTNNPLPEIPRKVRPDADKIERGLPVHSVHVPSQDDDDITSVDFYEREFPRDPRQFLVHIIGDRKVFKTRTVNISLGGMLLEHSLPSWVVGYCRVRVFKPDSNDFVDLTCALVENQDPKRRVRLQVVEDNHSRGPQKLKTWLAA